LDSFDGCRGNSDGTVTKDEWLGYYTDLSVSIPSGDYFVQTMESTWNICEDEDDSTYHHKINQYVDYVHSQLQNLTGDSKDQNPIHKIFDYFDLNQNEMITIDEFASMVAKLEIAVERKYLRGAFREIDFDKSGVVEFHEFYNFDTK
jgi:Ca2+-binding EF-hand superfamily protein